MIAVDLDGIRGSVKSLQQQRLDCSSSQERLSREYKFGMSDEAFVTTAAELVIMSRRWSPNTHTLFPRLSRGRASVEAASHVFGDKIGPIGPLSVVEGKNELELISVCWPPPA